MTMKNPIFIHNFPDLLEIQRSSYFWFLLKGINQELESFPSFFEDKTASYYLHLQDFYFLLPKKPPFITKQEDLTYALEIYFPAEIKIKKKKNSSPIVKKVNLCLGEIPLMTDQASFIVNGSERIVINQLVRSPGIYLQRDISDSGNRVFAAFIVCDSGNWFRIEFFDKLEKDEESFPIENINNDFSESSFSEDNNFQLSNPQNFDAINFQSRFKVCLDNGYELPLGCLLLAFGLDSHVLSKNLRNLDFVEEIFLDLDKDFDQLQGILSIYEFFLDENLISLITNKEVLKKKFFSLSKYFSIGKVGRYKLNQKLGLNIDESIDLITPKDLIAILDAIIDLKNFVQLTDDIDDLANKRIRSTGEILKNILSFGLERLERHIFETLQTEKLAKLEPENVIDSKFIVSSFKEFFSTSELSQFLDDVNPLADITHKRRVTVLGTDGINQENSTLEIRDIHPSHYGRLCPVETPEGQNAGLVTTLACCTSLNSFGFLESPLFLCNEGKTFIKSEPIFLDALLESKIPLASADILLNTNFFITVEELPVKYKNSFYLAKSSKVNLMLISPIQLFSVATSLVPFLEHDDANRVLMGANMQRQAVPLLYPQKPIVGTGIEYLVAYDSGMIIKSYSESLVIYSSSEKIILKDKNKQNLTYHLLKYTRTNSDTCINQRPLVWIGENVYAGQIIADGPSILEGELSLGRNLNLAYMTWEGYNFEDAVIISERIVIDDLLTSVHIEEYETEVFETPLGSEKLTSEISTASKYNRRNLAKNGIVTEGSFVKAGDILVGKITPKEEDQSPESKLLKAIFGKEIIYRYKDSSLRLPNGSEGRVIDVRMLPKHHVLDDEESPNYANALVRVYVAQIRKLEAGDKVSGRHGNKGVISKILPVQDMPYLPDGTPIDIIFNPLGVPSRMNVGQIFECLLGFAGQNLNSRFKVIPFDETFGKEASRILINQKLKQASLKKSTNWIFNEYSPGKILLTDGRTGEIFDNPILLGKSYILKLFHLVEDKIHARATGPYSLITQQPLGGRSQKGGQRFGEMEVWALEAYGATYTLQEILTLKSDDIDGRNYSYDSIFHGRIVANPKIPESFNVLSKELNSLGLDLATYKINLNPYDKKKDLIEETNMLLVFEEELQIQSKYSKLTPRKRILKELTRIKLRKNLLD